MQPFGFLSTLETDRFLIDQFVNHSNDDDHIMRRDIFQALADPTRRAIILLLAVQSMTPNAIADRFEISRQAVSKHIKVMSECELLSQEQKGREIYYHLQVDKMKDIEKWLEQFKELIATRFEQLDLVLFQLKQKKK